MRLIVTSGNTFDAEAPTIPQRAMAPCRTCRDESGKPAGDVLVQRPSGTWVRQPCPVCRGLRMVEADATPPRAGAARR
jgi:hypothetical protein